MYDLDQDDYEYLQSIYLADVDGWVVDEDDLNDEWMWDDEF